MSLSIGVRWLIILAVTAADAVGLRLTGMHLEANGVLKLGAALLTLFALGLTYTHWRPRERLADLAQTAAQLMAFFAAIGTASYLITASAAPLVDDALAAADRATGFDWPQWFTWVHERPTVALVLQLAYVSATPQLALIPIYLALSGQAERNSRLIWELMLSLAVIVPLSALLPAASAWVHYAVTDLIPAVHMPDFTALRSGTMREISLSRMEGLITFPSFHTTLAVLFVAALREHRLALAIGAVVNGLMLLSIPSEGGHYLVDVFAGALVAAVAIVVAAQIEQRLAAPIARAALSPAE
ncbi:MAG TPA: phosphatase PAP2 family protein [Stellaceae bacterium]|nr:phosphatase PAP2 family protein [Stellaceae bacterium]